jgi:hypothetical protein
LILGKLLVSGCKESVSNKSSSLKLVFLDKGDFAFLASLAFTEINLAFNLANSAVSP